MRLLSSVDQIRETDYQCKQLSALPVTVLNFSAAMGRTLIGFLADRVGPVNAMWTVIMLSGLTQLLVWTFVSTYAGIVRTFSQPAPYTPLSL